MEIGTIGKIGIETIDVIIFSFSGLYQVIFLERVYNSYGSYVSGVLRRECMSRSSV